MHICMENFGVMRKMCSVRNVSFDIERELYKRVVVPAVTYKVGT